jgi:hypothetical protein
MDYDRLRDDLLDYYGTAMFSGFPMAVIETINVENASEDELEELARKAGYDLSDYEEADEYYLE